MELEGKLFRKYEEQIVGTKGFRKREFVIDYAENPSYPQKIKFELVQEKCAELDKFNEGDTIKVYFNIRGSEWQGKYYVNLNAWKLEKLADAANKPNTDTDTTAEKTLQADNLPALNEEDDLPF
ncbi:MAG: DUF3127 domain-containing protein [Bacteroidia bacterium]|nr:DUF3127 domain-containing protein [Bacteroidia bacterium]MDW8345994.1 DUF3127 domain-containing protein [Bacteroidia bacterium]